MRHGIKPRATRVISRNCRYWRASIVYFLRDVTICKLYVYVEILNGTFIRVMMSVHAVIMPHTSDVWMRRLE